MHVSEMPQYRSHKIVRAVKLASIEGRTVTPVKGSPIKVDDALFLRYKPVPGDYLVVYPDGYQAFSPAKAFEDGYSPLVLPDKPVTRRKAGR